jgi:alpha-mannosidase
MADGVVSISPAFIKTAPIAWYASHHHSPEGENEYYAYSYLFGYTIDIPAGAKSVTLPNNSNIRILAMTVANEPAAVVSASPPRDGIRK